MKLTYTKYKEGVCKYLLTYLYTWVFTLPGVQKDLVLLTDDMSVMDPVVKGRTMEMRWNECGYECAYQ